MQEPYEYEKLRKDILCKTKNAKNSMKKFLPGAHEGQVSLLQQHSLQHPDLDLYTCRLPK